LTDEQAHEWRQIVDRMPADWFTREHFPLLALLCRHICRARFLAFQIDNFKPEWLKDDAGPARLEKFLAMAERETRAITALSRSLRLTHQSRMKAEKAATAVAAYHDGPRPWDEAFCQ
jgi:hypothetical protein